MKLNRSFFILLVILFLLCSLLYFIQKSIIHEGLTSDTNTSGVSEAQGYENDNIYGPSSGYIKVLSLTNSIPSSAINSPLVSSDKNIANLPITQYSIKSSYNSACSGNNGISSEMLMYVLSRGCRLIDLEIANVNGVPYVVSPDYNSIVNIDKTKMTSLDNIFKTAVTYGITNASGSAPNNQDPLFIHLRIHPDASYNHIYKDIASSIEQNIGSNLYNQGNNIPLIADVFDETLGKFCEQEYYTKKLELQKTNEQITNTLSNYKKQSNTVQKHINTNSKPINTTNSKPIENPLKPPINTYTTPIQNLGIKTVPTG
jgi:hypothetical protein